LSAHLQQAAKTNDRQALIIALRDEVWRSINDKKTGGRDIAALVRRWLELSTELKDKNRDSLERLRDVIIERIDSSESGRDIAALSKRLITVVDEIEALPDPNARKNPAQEARERARINGAA
jgi:hypothetical protein